MEYIQLAFAEATSWNRDNSYSALTATAESLLDFPVPERLQFHLSSLSTPHFATAYTLGTVGLIDGSISYLFSTVPLDDTPSQSGRIPLRSLVHGYRQIRAPVPPSRTWGWDALEDPTQVIPPNVDDGTERQRKATLLHATLHLPPPTTLNALFLRRISSTTQLTLALTSTRGPSHSPPRKSSAPHAALLAQLSYDTGRFCNEYLFSTDSALFGWRGLWNFGLDSTPGTRSNDGKVSLLSAGAEAYYSPLSSVVGFSTGLKFTTLPAATRPRANTGPMSSFPYTLTLTLTPLMGSLSTTYSLRASPNLAFSSRFGFNVYSWESEMVAGCEIWRRRQRPTLQDSSSSPATEEASSPTEENQDSVIKIRVDQSWNIRILWEGRLKSLLVTAGVSIGPGSLSALSDSTSTTNAKQPAHSSGKTAAAFSTQSAGGGSSGPSYWRGIGVSILYSS
ncbi:hypothetical protein VTN31DRAFT_4312 [Thermomyces dupontii]|uniref:uncharacterized protein n=1 Tax=Talaromyces thermophilus TaxID=28565 RepID=UPI0037422058